VTNPGRYHWSGQFSDASLAEILALAPATPFFKTWTGR
jgi:hypothetical protein